MADTNRDDRGMETGSRERSRAETQGDGDKRSLADDKLRSASDRDTGSRPAGLEAADGGGSERSGADRMRNEGGATERSGSNSSRGAQELPLDEVHKAQDQSRRQVRRHDPARHRRARGRSPGRRHGTVRGPGRAALSARARRRGRTGEPHGSPVSRSRWPRARRRRATDRCNKTTK
jgi:hypothetical protein